MLSTLRQLFVVFVLYSYNWIELIHKSLIYFLQSCWKYSFKNITIQWVACSVLIIHSLRTWCAFNLNEILLGRSSVIKMSLWICDMWMSDIYKLLWLLKRKQDLKLYFSNRGTIFKQTTLSRPPTNFWIHPHARSSLTVVHSSFKQPGGWMHMKPLSCFPHSRQLNFHD